MREDGLVDVELCIKLEVRHCDDRAVDDRTEGCQKTKTGREPFAPQRPIQWIFWVFWSRPIDDYNIMAYNQVTYNQLKSL